MALDYHDALRTTLTALLGMCDVVEHECDPDYEQARELARIRMLAREILGRLDHEVTAQTLAEAMQRMVDYRDFDARR